MNVPDDQVPNTKTLAASLCPTDPDSVNQQGWGVRENDLVAIIERHSHSGDSGRDIAANSVTQRKLPTQRQTRLTASQVSELIELYSSGVSVVRLADKFQIHKTTVSAHLHRAGVSVRGSQRSLTDAQVASAAQLYADGATLAELGERFSVSPSTMRDSLGRVGVAIRTKVR